MCRPLWPLSSRLEFQLIDVHTNTSVAAKPSADRIACNTSQSMLRQTPAIRQVIHSAITRRTARGSATKFGLMPVV